MSGSFVKGVASLATKRVGARQGSSPARTDAAAMGFGIGRAIRALQAKNDAAMAGRDIPAHENAMHGIQEFDRDKVQLDVRVRNTFRVGRYLLAQHTRFALDGEQEVVYYTAYDTIEKENKFIVGPDSFETFIASVPQTASSEALRPGPSNTNELEAHSAPDPTQFRVPPDAYPFLDLHYIPMRLPSGGESGVSFNLGIYLITPMIRLPPKGAPQILYYTAYNPQMRRNEFIIGPDWLEFFKKHERFVFAVAQISYPFSIGDRPAPYQVESARFILGQLRGDPQLASRGIHAWKAAATDPSWWLQVAGGVVARTTSTSGSRVPGARSPHNLGDGSPDFIRSPDSPVEPLFAPPVRQVDAAVDPDVAHIHDRPPTQSSGDPPAGFVRHPHDNDQTDPITYSPVQTARPAHPNTIPRSLDNDPTRSYPRLPEEAYSSFSPERFPESGPHTIVDPPAPPVVDSPGPSRPVVRTVPRRRDTQPFGDIPTVVDEPTTGVPLPVTIDESSAVTVPIPNRR